MSKKTSEPSEDDVSGADKDSEHAAAQAADRAVQTNEDREPNNSAANETSKKPVSSPATGNGLRPWPGTHGPVHPSEPDEPLL